MFNSNSGTLPVSIPLGVGGGSGFGGNGFDDIIALAIIAMIFGWNGNGNGIFGGGSGASDNYVLASDFANIQRQIDNATSDIRSQGVAIANGISSLGYDQLSQMNGINQNISNTGNSIQNAIQANAIAQMQNTNALSSQLASCCCDNEKATMQAQYNLSTESCATRQAIADAKSDIISAINQQSIDAMQSKIAEQGQVINNQFLLSQINRTPVPAYTVPNPYTGSYYYNGTTIA